jgi:hypothetical protein
MSIHKAKESASHRCFHEALSENLTSPEYKPFLSEEEILFLQRLIDENPEWVDTIYNAVDKVVQINNILDLHLIPSVVLMVSHIVVAYFSHTMPKHVDSFIILRFLLDSLIDSELFFLPDVKRSVVKHVVDTSLELLKMSLPTMIVKKNCCFW